MSIVQPIDSRSSGIVDRERIFGFCAKMLLCTYCSLAEIFRGHKQFVSMKMLKKNNFFSSLDFFNIQFTDIIIYM